MSKNIIETHNLSKVFALKGHNKHFFALDHVNLKVREGEKFCLLGPNGAGKTTMVSILTTLIQPTNGYALIDGLNILSNSSAIKSKIGLMLGSDMLYYRMTAYANLKFFCKIYEIKNYKNKIQDVAKEFELEKWLKQYVENFSTGMKVKLSLCRIFLTNPKILFLDEPTLGLDIKTTNFIIDKLRDLDQTVFLTSHNMNVVEKLGERIAFIQNGRIKKVGNKTDLQNLMQNKIKIFIEIGRNAEELKGKLLNTDFINKIDEIDNGFLIYLKEKNNYQDLFSILQNYPVTKFQEIDMNIEDLFLKVISE